MNPLPVGQLLRDKEHDEVLVEVVEVAGIPLVEIVGELRFGVVVRGDSGVLGHDTEGVAVEHDTENTGHSLSVAGGRGAVHLASGIESIVGARTLPEGNGLGTDELGVLVMERVGLEKHVRGGAELGKHDNVLEVFGCEPLLAALVEEGAHAGQTIDVERHLIRGVADEVGVGHGVGRREILAIAGIEAREKIDRSRITRTSNSAGRMVGAVAGLQNHVVDGAHDQSVHTNGHGLIDLVEEHGDEGVELGSAGEGLLHLTLCDGAVDLEGCHLVEELGLSFGLVENVRIIGRAIGQLPRLVLDSHRHFGTDLLHDRAVLPRITQDRRGRTLIRPDDEDHLADVVNEGLDILVESAGVEDRGTDVDDVGQVLVEDDRVADGLLSGRIDELVNLRYFHDYFSFRYWN